MSEKRVSGEALSQKRFEEEIRKYAKQARKTVRERLLEFESSGYVRNFVAIRAISQFEEDVLGVVAKTEAERNQKLAEAIDKLDYALDWVVPIQHLEAIKEKVRNLKAFLGQEGSGQQQEQKQP